MRAFLISSVAAILILYVQKYPAQVQSVSRRLWGITEFITSTFRTDVTTHTDGLIETFWWTGFTMSYTLSPVHPTSLRSIVNSNSTTTLTSLVSSITVDASGSSTKYTSTSFITLTYYTYLDPKMKPKDIFRKTIVTKPFETTNETIDPSKTVIMGWNVTEITTSIFTTLNSPIDSIYIFTTWWYSYKAFTTKSPLHSLPKGLKTSLDVNTATNTSIINGNKTTFITTSYYTHYRYQTHDLAPTQSLAE